ncbi:MAG TPA: hypothetical protein VF633_09745 [Brevundimonas sp.]|jgi:hypothetical protein
MADVVPQIVWITDAEGRVEFLNRQWSDYRVSGATPTTATEVAALFLPQAPASGLEVDLPLIASFQRNRSRTPQYCPISRSKPPPSTLRPGVIPR